MSERKFLRDLFDAAVAAAMPDIVLPEHLPHPPKGRTIVVGAGKASAAMARAVEQNWSGPISGLVVTRYGHAVDCTQIEIVEAAHPVPDAAGLAATKRILSLAKSLGPDDLLIVLISGGGSALLTLPTAEISFSDKQIVNQMLLKSGVTISDMNIVRKHLSAVKGGRLALAAWPAKVCCLMISDVPGDDPGTIASGPTVGDSSTLNQSKTILQRLNANLPANVIAALENPASETPNPDHPHLANTKNHIIATPLMSLQAAAKLARSAGVKSIILGDAIEGEARELGKIQAQKALTYASDTAPIVLLSGGETTVTLHGEGVGGRNVEFLLGLSQQLDSTPSIYALAGDTDGVDGAAEIAGAFVDPTTLERAKNCGYPIEQALQKNDGHSFFARLGDQVITGPTLTNVNDFRAILVGQLPKWKPEES